MLCERLYALILITTLFLVPRWSMGDITPINSEDLQDLLNKGVTVVDLRRADEWDQTGVIANSHLVTFFDKFGRFDGNAWLQQISKVAEDDQPVVLICRAGVRSNWVAKWMEKHTSYKQIYDATGGIQQWLGDGYPVVEWNQ